MADMLDEAGRCYERYSHYLGEMNFPVAERNAWIFTADYGPWLLARVRKLEAALKVLLEYLPYCDDTSWEQICHFCRLRKRDGHQDDCPYERMAALAAWVEG